jgi:hypothetical protein
MFPKATNDHFKEKQQGRDGLNNNNNNQPFYSQAS